MNQTMTANEFLVRIDDGNLLISIPTPTRNASGNENTSSAAYIIGGHRQVLVLVAFLLAFLFFSTALICHFVHKIARNVAREVIQEFRAKQDDGAKKVYDDIVQCKNILVARGILTEDSGDGKFKANKLSMAESRARPNRRLQVSFGVDNGFTTNDEDFRKEFKQLASLTLKDFDKNWAAAAKCARSFVEERLKKAEQGVKLFELIQVLSMRLSLQAVHHVNLDDVDNDQVRVVAEEINRLWILSKKDATRQSWSEQAKLHDALSALCPDWNHSNSKENPLNLILPSYETLWRIVLRCFIEVVFRTSDGIHDSGGALTLNGEWRARLHKFLMEPSTANLKSRGNYGGSVLDVVQEALRLYPPTRRVHREFQYEGEVKPEEVAANVEAVQRQHVKDVKIVEIWHPAFNPEIWAKHGGVLNEAFLAFGETPFQCPAKAKFAYWAIAILVGALSKEVGEDWKLDPDPLAGLDYGQPLATDREDYANVVLKRK